jgi:hypothetical protein
MMTAVPHISFITYKTEAAITVAYIVGVVGHS